MNLSIFRKPSRYINSEVNTVYPSEKISSKYLLRAALCFPDVYDIGMSHLGLRILYTIINDLPYASSERFYSPWTDMEEYLLSRGLPLTSLETGTPLNEFDLIGFTLQYELSYTTILNMLHLGGVPILSEERRNGDPLVIGGGPCAFNPSPLEPFFDAFLIGDGEDAIVEISEICFRFKKEGDQKRDTLLEELAKVEGIYIPSKPIENVEKRYLKDLDSASYPCSLVMPYTQIVHDRITIEVSRGCTHGCRFCQAGMIYRPLRERSPNRILKIAEESLMNTGYKEVSFSSLSVGDYSQFLPLIKAFNKKFSHKRVSLSLPSIKAKAVTTHTLKEIRSVRKSGFTIAPDAATERLRRVINKELSEDDYERALFSLFKEGWTNLKLYFMIGLPDETDEDVVSIPTMVQKALKTAKKFTKRRINVSVGLSTFVPKSHTPFQWYGQIPVEEMDRRIGFLREDLTKRKIKFKGHDKNMSLLEAVFARGGKELAPLIETAWREGARLDPWTESFDFTKWLEAMNKTGIDLYKEAGREFGSGDDLPWDHIKTGVDKEYLWKEYNNAIADHTTSDCTAKCHACGLKCTSGQYRYDKSEMNITGLRKPHYKKHFSQTKLRVIYSKTDKMRYLSHLELMSAIQRGLHRAGVRIVYSQGFNPAPKISMGPALSVGVAGLKEYMDMDVHTPFDLFKYKEITKLSMPKGINILNMFFVNKNTPSLNKFITAYRYELVLPEKIEKERISKKIKSEEFTRVLPNLIDFDIINGALHLFLKDTENRQMKLSNIVEAMLDCAMNTLDIKRTALYGWNDGWTEPDDPIYMNNFSRNNCRRD